MCLRPDITTNLSIITLIKDITLSINNSRGIGKNIFVGNPHKSLITKIYHIYFYLLVIFMLYESNIELLVNTIISRKVGLHFII